MPRHCKKDTNKSVLILANHDVGLYKFRKEILKALISEGYTVYISLPNGEYITKLTELGCRFLETPVDRRGVNPFKDLKLLFRYLKTISSIDPCAVLTYTIKPNIYGGIACRLLRRPYLANITGLGTSIENPGVLQCLALLLYKLGVNGSRHTFFQNKANLEFMQSKKIGGKEIHLLPGSGVDIEAHRYREYPPNDETIRFLSIMRIMRDKGIYELLSCAEAISKKLPNASFTLVGDYDDESYKEPVEQAQEKGYITYLGFRSDIDELIESHHCIINPSYHEGMSNVLLEAAACGRPVIASKVPGCIETFDDGITGFGFEVKNTDDLANCIERFTSLPHAEKQAMGKKAREKIVREFDRKQVVSTYINCIKNLEKRKDK